MSPNQAMEVIEGGYLSNEKTTIVKVTGPRAAESEFQMVVSGYIREMIKNSFYDASDYGEIIFLFVVSV